MLPIDAPKSVLFISHDAHRAGATLFLLNFLRWFKRNTDIPFQILLCARGEMERDFEELAPVWYLDPRIGRRAALRTALRNLFGRAYDNRTVTFSELASRIGSATHLGLIYSNTVANGRVLEALAQTQCPVITQVHELEYAIRTFAGENFRFVKDLTDHFIVVSDAVRDNLIRGHGIPEEKVERIFGFVSTEIQPSAEPALLRKAFEAETGVPAHSYLVGGCGWVDWRKGCDLFIQLGVAIRKVESEVLINLVWLGQKPSPRDFSLLDQDIDRAGLAGRVHFIGARTNPVDYLALFDVLAMVSREDPFPLVVMESAALAVPTVCFDNSGGSREFVENDAGFVVPYLDISAMAEKILVLLEDEALRQQLGARAREKVRERHDISVVAPMLVARIEQMLNNG